MRNLLLSSILFLVTSAQAQETPFPPIISGPTAVATVEARHRTRIPYYYFSHAVGAYVQVQANDGCEPTPVTVEKRRYRFIERDYSYTGGSRSGGSSSESSSYSDRSSYGANSSYGDRSSYNDSASARSGHNSANASSRGSNSSYGSASESGSASSAGRSSSSSSWYHRDWYNDRLKDKDISDDSDKVTFFRCL